MGAPLKRIFRAWGCWAFSATLFHVKSRQSQVGPTQTVGQAQGHVWSSGGFSKATFGRNSAENETEWGAHCELSHIQWPSSAERTTRRGGARSAVTQQKRRFGWFLSGTVFSFDFQRIKEGGPLLASGLSKGRLAFWSGSATGQVFARPIKSGFGSIKGWPTAVEKGTQFSFLFLRFRLFSVTFLVFEGKTEEILGCR